MTTGSDTAERPAAGDEPPLALLRGETPRIVGYVLLALMAFADAFGFWITLTRIIQQDTNLVLVFVLALSAGSVAAAHEIGRLVRYRNVVNDGHAGWITVLAVLWLGLGLIIAGIRFYSSTPQRSQSSGVLSGPASSTTSSSTSTAVLLLCLYLLTGALAMTHAYRYGNPIKAEMRRLRRERRRLLAQRLTESHQHRAATGQVQMATEDKSQVRDQYDRDSGLQPVRDAHLHAMSREENAVSRGDPSATDALMDPDFPDPEPRPS